jgi:hypothetical protein
LAHPWWFVEIRSSHDGNVNAIFIFCIPMMALNASNRVVFGHTYTRFLGRTLLSRRQRGYVVYSVRSRMPANPLSLSSNIMPSVCLAIIESTTSVSRYIDRAQMGGIRWNLQDFLILASHPMYSSCSGSTILVKFLLLIRRNLTQLL